MNNHKFQIKENNKNLKFDDKKILDFIKQKKSTTFLELAKFLKLKISDNQKLTTHLNQLLKENKLIQLRNNNYTTLNFLFEQENVVSISTKRLGFVDFELENGQSNSAIIFPDALKGILDGDVLLTKIYSYINENNQTLYIANIEKLIARGSKFIIGKLFYRNDFLTFTPLDEKNKTNFIIENTNPIVIKKFDFEKDIFRMRILENKKGNFVWISFDKKVTSLDEKDFMVKKILSISDINLNFNEEVINESEKLPDFVSEDEILRRTNLINLQTVTIDGMDTKDFDDAISCKKEGDNYRLHIHIADVSHYVKENSVIDTEALARGTSIYLPNKVIPMLPFKLSNGICSLNPNEIRACLTLEVLVDKLGNNIEEKLYASVIKSDFRLTYNEVNDFLENKKNDIPEFIKNNLLDAYELSKIILNKKSQQGYIDFEIQEPKIVLNDKLEVEKIYITQEGKSEKLIEAFMVHANETVASMMEHNQIPSIYRIHEKPSNEKLIDLQNFLTYLGIQVSVPFDGKPKSFENMVQKIKTKAFDDNIKFSLLKTMQKAIYSTKNIGHFGLASEAYSHFTSPIRRYPDLLLHRLVRRYLIEGEKIIPEDIEKLTSIINEIAIRNTESEKVAVQIERDVVDFWKSQFFKQFIGQEFDATLVSVEKFGVFMNIEKFQTSILIRFDTIETDKVLKISDFEAAGSKISLKVGKNYKIKIASIDNEKGKINALLVR
ncbi:ribonuclease R family protein [Metamycoplasma hyosynoviae]|uniref:ribonuclease R family protein n=1 Tax=Metamycoplasma hyosynoviae TaxID=29559 RepID=UPI00235823FF|nr:VacB/RNase II family 3'-5' exoribonuclease [Metamycoplasma hyosynoviae]MDC8920402.1 VacB/RNase II family 3'-5' exoribonuclease [Metamycoplasma hyosynoviae]MDD1366132.1 VacB/RNase II family 3'-5' exoribonuclease [Metamycoplasma hyosynoviae]MDD7848290.1 VacB/RNase II family 3'-5' exoribonuclease [Metamycoplasma hyosynoviae]MDD7895496.1 VacB/RNase II family 3'-5' exoribonuclease [Metamycoplasma hyosynoviae]